MAATPVACAAGRRPRRLPGACLSDNPTTAEAPSPIARQNTYELVADRLVALISERHLRPGDAIPTERELTERYGVGRSSVREALRVLESNGLIASTRGGFVVAAASRTLNKSIGLLLVLEEANLRELFELRRMLEVETAALAAARRRRRHLAQLAETIEEMEHGLADEDRYIAADVRFHLVLAEASGNRMVEHVMLAIRDLLRRALSTIYRIPESAAQSIADHRAILAAVESTDVPRARAAMRDHLDSVARAIDGALPPARTRKARRG
jgi:GntR family transcriptional repressor for pyruvate dehydrogenase complex